MYTCCNFKRFIKLLVIDIIVLLAAAFIFIISRTINGSSASEPGEEPVPLPVIMYHSVFSTEPSEYVITPRQLDSDLSWLSDHGFTAVSAEELVQYVHGKGELPEKPVLITFDDGHYNNLSAALPLFEKYDMRFIVSVVGRFTDSLAAADPHNSAYSYLTWNDISELINSGRAEIGNHTYDMHSISGPRKGCSRIAGESEEDYRSAFTGDISTLQNTIRSACGYVPYVFAYPFGQISKESIPVLREMGFLVTLTCYERMNYITRDPDCLFGLDRYNRSGLLSTEEYMSRLLNGNK
ncbi:MAG: polysaccharide deacetylase family protein [Ruminococcus sp.]|nr:polysaccharide deacetylase family protein [Ruminococcus sp.]